MRCGDIFSAPLDGSTAATGDIKGGGLLAGRRVLLADGFVFGGMCGDEVRPVLITQKAGGDRNSAAGVDHMDHRLAVVRRDLDGRCARGWWSLLR